MSRSGASLVSLTLRIQARPQAHCARWLFRRKPRRLLLWITCGLDLDEYVDVVALSRTSLASDLDATSVEASVADRVLCERGPRACGLLTGNGEFRQLPGPVT